MASSLDTLLTEAATAPVDGWDFAWLDGRATEQRPSWGYQRLLGARLSQVDSALDLQTGGGEVLAGAVRTFPRTTAATEAWPVNLERATRTLHPRGVVVVAGPADGPIPFADEAFELVTSRHPVSVPWPEIARVLRPGGTYLAQHVGPASVFELAAWFLGPLPEAVRRSRHPDGEVAAARAAGLDVRDVRAERLRMEFHDVGAVTWFLRKVIWIVPGFDVDRSRDRLSDLHEHIAEHGPFVAHSTRHLIEAVRPG